MTKSEFRTSLAESLKIKKGDAIKVTDAFYEIVEKELKKSGEAIIPDIVKLTVVKKPATKDREGINPFTKEPTVFKAKPARKVLKARPASALKKAVS